MQYGPLEGVLFADYGSDLGSGSTVPGMPFMQIIYSFFLSHSLSSKVRGNCGRELT